MKTSFADRLQAAGSITTEARDLAASGRVGEAEQRLDASRAGFEELERDLRGEADATPVDPARLARARGVLPLVSLRALFAEIDPGSNLRAFFEEHAAEGLTPEIVGLFRQEADGRSAQARRCAEDSERCRGHIERLEARVAVLSRFVFLFRMQCLAEAVRPGDYEHTAAAVSAELRELGPLPPGDGVRETRWRELERRFTALLERLPAPAAATPPSPSNPQTQE